MIIDNPHILRGIVKKYGAKGTHEEEETLVNDPKITEHLDKYAKKLKEMTDPEWEGEYHKWYEKWFGKKEDDKKSSD